MIIPAITDVIGIITRGLNKNVEAISGNHSIDSLQTTAVLTFGFPILHLDIRFSECPY
jgi:hypothetical protein